MKDLRVYQLRGIRAPSVVFAVADAQNVVLLDDEGMGIMCSKEAIEKGLVPPDPRVMIRDYKIRIEGSPKKKADGLYTPGSIVDLVVDLQTFQHGMVLHCRYTVRSPRVYEVLEGLNLSDVQVSAWMKKYVKTRERITGVEQVALDEIKALQKTIEKVRELTNEKVQIFQRDISLQQLLN